MEVGLVVGWLIAVLAIGLLAVPFAAWLFPRGDHGAYAFTLGIVVVGVIGHLVGHLTYRLPALVAGLVVLLALSAAAWTRVSIDRRALAEATALFVAAFVLLVGLRAVEPSAGTNPHWVGEMFLDYGILSSLERAGHLPPEDMWFAGETVRYHYGGHLLTSLLAGLTGTAPAYAYNLGLATFFACLVTMAWGVAGSIARPMAVSTRMAAALGAFFVAFAANLETVLRVIAWLLPRRVTEALVSVVGADPAVVDWSPGSFFYYDSSRVITRQVTTATEFPLFSWLHGDLHGHVLVKPVLLLLVAVGVAYWYTSPDSRRRRVLLVLGVMPPIMGLTAVINIWSLPTVTGLVAVVLAFAPGHPLTLFTNDALYRLRSRFAPIETTRDRVAVELLEGISRLMVSVAIATVALVLAVLWTAPYWAFVVLGGPGGGISTWSAGTPPGAFLVVQGAFIIGFTLYLGARVATADHRRAIGLATAAMVLAFVAVGWTVLGLAIAVLVVAWWASWSDTLVTPDGSSPSRVGPEAMLIVAGVGIILIVELVKLEGDSFNSIFKPYADVWQLWGVALGVVAARLIDGWPLDRPDRDRSVWAAVSLVVVILLVLSTGVYGALAIPAHIDDGNSWSDATTQVRGEVGTTLDATAYLEVLYPEEAEAIRWVDDLEGQPTIVTGVPSWYIWQPAAGDGASAPSSLTGVPTVLGWEHHQRQYRGAPVVDSRTEDVIEIYLGVDDRQRELLDAYEVDYVYVGPIERATWAQISIGEVEGVTVAVEFDDVTIYAVDRTG